MPKPEVDRFMGLYEAKRLADAEQAAQSMTQRYPKSAFAWKALGTTLLEGGRVEEALEHLHRSVEINDADPLSLTSLAAVYYRQGDHDQAVRYQTRAVELQPDYAPAQYRLAEMLQSAGKHIKALEHASKAREQGYDDFRSGVLVGSLLYQTKYFSQALDIYQKLERDYPGHAPVYNNLGNLYKDIGQYELAESYYQRALEQQPDYVMAYSNIFFAKHYNPDVSQQDIIDFATGWDSRFALPPLPASGNRLDPAKPLRVGLISSGFRIHPVGQMIATAMEHSRPDIHLYAYTTNDHDDYVTQKIREATRVWRPVRHLGQEALAQQIRDDAIDILIDLSGHGDGSCLQAISMRPAPLCVKWVGGLVNTMGLSSIDYLLSDSIETPAGVDDQYTEKLIRLPDDYICYMPCPYAPATASLPAVKNGYVTLGCLNNPAKIGETLLGEWAKLMHELPESRLLLRGAQYESEDFCRWIRETLARHGIEAYRVILEGPTKHAEFLATYQRIDIALDSWPYSGGLTTCEAMLMGVPVVTLPGPTFAGRHSATHLINAGMPELVTGSWEEYRQRVLELANDLPNLALIRAGLRTVLHYSPVCDAPRFANHFNNALRAIWQRHCDDKPPEALTFNQEGEAWFTGEDELVELVEAREEDASESAAFEWDFDEPITIIDNAAVLPRHPDYPQWMESGKLAVISFDPASLLNNRIEELKTFGELHHYPHALLGDGQPATLYATLDAEKGGTLKPLPEEQQPECQKDKRKVLAELPINTVALDQIEGLASVDMLVLDDQHDAIKILENGEKKLEGTLLIQVKVAFQATHESQSQFGDLQDWAGRNGFRFFRFKEMNAGRHLFGDRSGGGHGVPNQLSGEALFIPDEGRLKLLSREREKKLEYLVSSFFSAACGSDRSLEVRGGGGFLHSDFCENKSFGTWSHQGLRAIKSRPGYIDVSGYANITVINSSSFELIREYPSSRISILMPCINLEEGKRAAKAMVDRAGMSCHVFILMDTLRQGFIKTINSAYGCLDSKYVVYCAQDAFPGMLWLKKAYNDIESSNAGLLCFNDGKWRGRIASFGMVRSSWVDEVYGGELLYSGYSSHCADDELTFIARSLGVYVYSSDSVLVEVDYNKKLSGGGNRSDREVFWGRVRSRFSGRISVDLVKEMSGEYGVNPEEVEIQ
ncbi:O-linked N-acetylglucosamine transferase family protein [Halomonas organivorans]|uniref:Probable UDP-N-acetylglucosamine--peptide N-acetylglucosaminyltransferase SPINDLY n=1 Tax=Halomonas organivorans TaxID=257772 RepID=A0A7W5BWI7_9GAMM|nr:putative O-linked N-acetylglucosamine transferase (SPINDLY family) [Halomonas organivorans]